MANGFVDYNIDTRTPNAAGVLASFQERSEQARRHPGMRHMQVSYGDDELRPTALERRSAISGVTRDVPLSTRLNVEAATPSALASSRPLILLGSR